MFRLDSIQRGDGFSERARNQKSQPPRMPLLRWTRTRRSLEQAPQRLRMAEWLLVRARGTYIARTPEACLWGSCYICSPDWTRTSNPSINSRMLCQLSYGGLFCFRCWFPLQRVITIPGLFGLRNLKCYEVHHFWVVWVASTLQYPRLPVERRGSAGSRGIHKEPCLAALCAELAAAHFQFEELTLYRLKLFVIRVCAELF